MDEDWFACRGWFKTAPELSLNNESSARFLAERRVRPSGKFGASDFQRLAKPFLPFPPPRFINKLTFRSHCETTRANACKKPMNLVQFGARALGSITRETCSRLIDYDLWIVESSNKQFLLTAQLFVTNFGIVEEKSADGYSSRGWNRNLCSVQANNINQKSATVCCLKKTLSRVSFVDSIYDTTNRPVRQSDRR